MQCPITRYGFSYFLYLHYSQVSSQILLFTYRHGHTKVDRAQCNHWGPYKRDKKVKEERDGMTEVEVGMMHFEDGGRGQEPRNTDGL